MNATRARSLASIALLVAMAMTMTGCTRGTVGGSRDVLVIAQQWEPMSLNPALENGTSATEWGLLLFSYLVKYDDRGRLVTDVATEIPSLRNGGISADGLTITYHLHGGIRFADGRPLTAQDCVWSIDAINNPRNNVQSRFGYDAVESARAPNATTLVLRLKHPFAPLISVVLAPQGFPILPRHLLERYPDINHVAFNALPVGSGPYVVSRWYHGDRVVLQANPQYWRGRPAISSLVIRFVADPQTAINLLQTHEADGYFNEQSYADYPILQGLTGYRVTSTPQNAVGAIIFNTRDPVTADPRVRMALAEAIDIKTVVAKTYRGALRSGGAGRGLFLWAYDPRSYPDIPYDPGGARRLLDESGWKLGNDGVRHKDGRSLTASFILQAQTPGDVAIGDNVAQYERAVGVRVLLKQFNITQFVAPSTLGGPVYGGKFQMALYPFENGDDPDTTDQFACSNVPPNGYNKSRFCDPQADVLLRAGVRTYDRAKRKALYSKLEALLYRKLPIALLYQTRQVNTFTQRLHGQSTSLSGAFWNVGAWRLSPR